MKIIEPLSSALLVTGCVYAAGIAQNSALMNFFGINPAFSQPAIDKILYDGGLVTFELFSRHLIFLFALTLIAIPIYLAILAVVAKLKRFAFSAGINWTADKINLALIPLSKLSGLIILIYLIVLTLLSYNKAKEDGVRIGQSFIDTCHGVIIEKGKDKTEGCAFNKDRDSIWYYTIKDEASKTSAKPLSEVDQIIYLDPVDQN